MEHKIKNKKMGHKMILSKELTGKYFSLDIDASVILKIITGLYGSTNPNLQISYLLFLSFQFQNGQF